MFILRHMPEYAYLDRDQSWLDFNFKVLEEAGGKETPLLERIRFQSIYASRADRRFFPGNDQLYFLLVANEGSPETAIPATSTPVRPKQAIYNFLSRLPGAFYILILFLLTALSGCHSHESLPSPLWFYYYSNGPHTKWDSLLNTGSFVELRPDGSYTQDFGRFEFGGWTYKEGQLYLTNQKHTTYIYHVNSVTRKQMQLVFGKDRTGHFKGNPQFSGSDSKDPFSIQNNQWRIPATHKESIPEIRHRLFNHFEFWEAYFNWAVDNDIETIDPTHFPTPLKIYGNGFGLKRYDSLSVRWKSCFFDEEDCHKADTLIKGVFRRNNINWLEYDNQYKTFISGFHQMKEHLR
jgi:hypothetical protein